MSKFHHDKFRYYPDDIDKTPLDARKGSSSIPANRGDFTFKQLQIVHSMWYDTNTKLN